MAENQQTPDSGQELNPPSAEVAEIITVIKNILGYIGIRAKVNVTRDAEGYLADIKTKRSGAVLIGRRGATLKALQHLVRTIVRRQFPELPPVVVDVAGYRQRRDNFLRKKALAIAKIVTETKREMAVDFLSEKEMAVVQDALKDMPEVRVYAVGTGSRRNVVIAPTRPGTATG